MPVQHILDLDGGDVLATGNDDVLGTVLDIDVTVLVPDARSPLWNQPPSNASSLARDSSDNPSSRCCRA
jgi:hypothetical protein